ncbi:hypothetical protein Tco_0952753 [Tanacetum coccineum]|uniref:Uncharacterized protein n=1 Tax=Tanacetum coccineum TaxID=301880 RepID=A0ABQ5E0R7_9ASTR
MMQKAKNNMRKFNFKKAVVQKFKEYDQKLKALTNFNVSKAFEKAVQAKVLTEIKKLLPTHIPNAIANYVKPALTPPSSNAIALDSPYLLVLITGTSQSRQHGRESRKSPTKSLFDVGSRRISIVTVNTKEYHSDVLAIITRIMRRTF